jgi:hexokinase
MWSLHRSASLQAAEQHGLDPRSLAGGTAHLSSSFACNGSVVERYPGFRERVQRVVGALATTEGGEAGGGGGEGEGNPPTVLLHVAEESAIFGAAVAVACERENWRRDSGE